MRKWTSHKLRSFFHETRRLFRLAIPRHHVRQPQTERQLQQNMKKFDRSLFLNATAPFLQSMTYEAASICYEDFPKTEEPVWILGKQYSALYDLDDIKHDILSRIWFTYRKGFSPIGGTGPTFDTGWGCMLRCGQMMMAQALLIRHCGRDWRWYQDKYVPKYYEVLQMFRDMKSCCYSIHQIASMGASEGKQVGEWFGPNTIAQVLKKLAVYDEWSDMVVHVALDNTVIIEDIRQLCECKCDKCVKKKSSASNSTSSSASTLRNRQSQDALHGPSLNNTSMNSVDGDYETVANDGGGANVGGGTNLYKGGGATGGVGTEKENVINGQDQHCDKETNEKHWRPLLLMIPLRLGLTEINPVYSQSLKSCLQLPQSVGIIGGKPNHAHYFIGSVEDSLLYLDPHTTQQAVDFLGPNESDETYHCPYSSHMPIEQLDPSIALGFFCGSEAEFDDFCHSVHKFLICGHQTAMFEIHTKRPHHWEPFQPYKPQEPRKMDFDVIENRQFDSDEEFELL